MFGRKEVKTEMPIELMSYDQLLAMKVRIDHELSGRGAAELQALKEKLLLIADAQGITVQDLFKPQRKKRELVIRYRDPENPENTWTGMGKTKKWLQEKLDAGHAMEEFAVQ